MSAPGTLQELNGLFGNRGGLGMKIVIVGGGAIGRLFGAYLGQGGNEIVIVDVDPFVVDEMQNRGIGIMGHSGAHPDAVDFFPVSATTDAETITDCDLVLLTVKSFATKVAAQSVAHLVNEKCPILFIQTGLGNQVILKGLFPVDSILAGLTFMSGTAFGNSRVRHGRWGMTFLGELNGKITSRVEQVCQVFNGSGIETKWSHRIVGRLWAKVITYATLNTLTSVLRVPNGKLLEEEESIALVKDLLAEGEAVAMAHGVPPLGAELYDLFEEVCRESANNLSSMLQDILNERPTEIDAQSGAICRYAEMYNLEVPRHRAMVALVSLLERWRPGLNR